ncbi:MAG: hypothetical protein ABIN89_09630 [Chitinophagaceae bacterium]
MSTKFIVITIIIVVIAFLIAAYSRLINIDAIITRQEKQLKPKTITVYDLQEYFNSRSNGRFIINDKSLRTFSSCIPPVILHSTVAKDGKHMIMADGSGKEFVLGEIESTRVVEGSTYYTIRFQPKDELTYKTSFSLIPYYYGFYILSPGPVSRYYHYYSFKLEKEDKTSLLLEWKYSTYKGADGKLIPDLFGDNKEGLVNVVIKKK